MKYFLRFDKGNDHKTWGPSWVTEILVMRASETHQLLQNHRKIDDENLHSAHFRSRKGSSMQTLALYYQSR